MTVLDPLPGVAFLRDRGTGDVLREPTGESCGNTWYRDASYRDGWHGSTRDAAASG